MLDSAANALENLWEGTSNSIKLIASWIWMIIFKLPLLWWFVAWIGLGKNMTVKEFILDMMWNKEFASMIEDINKDIKSISDKKIQTAALDIFSEIWKDASTLDDLNKLISKASPKDKKILEGLKPQLAVMVAGLLNNRLSKMWDEIDRLQKDDEDLNAKYLEITQLENKLSSSEYRNILSEKELLVISTHILKAKQRIQKKLSTIPWAVVLSSLSWDSKNLESFVWTFSLNNSILQSEILARLNDLDLSGNTQLKHKLNKALSQSTTKSQLDAVERLRWDYGINVSFQEIASILSVAYLEDVSRVALHQIKIPQPITSNGLNLIAQKLYTIDSDFTTKKAHIPFTNYALPQNKWYDYGKYRSEYNIKFQELITQAKLQWMGTINWGGNQKPITKIEQELNEQVLLENNKHLLPIAIKEINAMINWSPLTETLKKYSEIIWFTNYKLNENVTLHKRVLEKTNTAFAKYIEYKDSQDSTLISDSDELTLKEIKNTMENHKNVLIVLGYANIQWAINKIDEILNSIAARKTKAKKKAKIIETYKEFDFNSIKNNGWKKKNKVIKKNTPQSTNTKKTITPEEQKASDVLDALF